MIDKMTKLEKIRQKIIEAVPEIVALKFGCEITDGEYNFVIYRETKQNFWTKELNERGSIFQFSKPLKGFKIIGRPLILEDILMAIKANGDVLTPKGLWELQELYQLGKPLTDQSPEFINFIYEIFYGK